MAQHIRPDICDSLMCTPLTVYPQGASDSLGDTTEAASVTYNGYVYENIEKVLNNLGQEELSNMQIYLRGDDADAIATTSLVSCLDVVKSRILARKIYRGREAAKVIGILYLP